VVKLKNITDMTATKFLKKMNIAILATDGFEEIELTAPMEELRSYGATVDIVSEKENIKSWKNRDWGSEFKTDALLREARVEDYDTLILPGGTINPDRLRRNEKALEFIREFNRQEKLIAAICHGPQLLIEADLLRDKSATSFHSIRTDMINAGAKWEDTAVVRDGNIVTSQNPDTIPAFLKKILDILKLEAMKDKAQ
jgi:protease I